MRLLKIERDAFLQALTGEAGVSFDYADQLDVPLSEVLGGLPTFDGVDGAGLRRLASAAHREQMPAGTVVCEAGEESDAAYVVLSGRVELQRDGQLSSVLVPGDIFGELSVLYSTPRPERALVTEPVVVAILPASAMLAELGTG
jgi:CRP-like cAMP-binding protein